jgi:hypothetical protein
MTGYLTVGRIIPKIEVAEPAAWGYVSEVFDKVNMPGHNQTSALMLNEIPQRKCVQT